MFSYHSRIGWWSAAVLCCCCGLWLERAEAQRDHSPGTTRILLKLESVAGKAVSGGDGLRRLAKQYGAVDPIPLLDVIGRQRGAGKTTANTGVVSGPAAADLARWHVVEFPEPIDAEMIASAYAKLDAVDAAQPNFLRRLCAIPDDPLYAQQTNLKAMGVDLEQAGNARGIIVAVVDSGVDDLHPDLAGRVWRNSIEAAGEEGVDDDANGYVDDVRGWDFTDAPGHAGSGDFVERDRDPADESGHGTHVAGIIGAVIDNGIGIVGLADGAQVMALRAGFQMGGAGVLEDDDIAAAIVYAVDNGAHVINLSFGDPSFSALLRDVIRYANDAGVLVVAAVGNEGDGDVFYPARLGKTVAVAATADDGRVASFSNWGTSVDIAAPGIGILSLSPGGSFTERSGTSMSAAHVSASAALLLARWPHLNTEQLRSALMHAAIDIGSRGWDVRTGAGLAQVSASLAASPLTIQLNAATGSTVGDSIEVEVTLMGAGMVTYTLSWGYGSSPEEWTPFVSQQIDIEPGTQTVLSEVWSTGMLPDSSYVVRAEAASAGFRHNDHLSIELMREQPDVHSLQWRRGLNGERWDYWVEWRTSVPTTGVVEVVRRDGEGERLEVPAPQNRSDHRVVLPQDLPIGAYEFFVRASGSATGSSLSLDISERSVGRWYFQLEAATPDGYLLPMATDFDGDGEPELSAMIYGVGTYGTTSFFELPSLADMPGSQLLPVHTSSRLFIPWSVHDLDADGAPELMAVDAARVRLLEAEEGARFPDTVIWEQSDVWGGASGDLDADGRQEMYLRSSRGPSLRTHEHDGSNNGFARVAIHTNPTEGSNGLGERQVVGDFDGDGRGDLLIGDEDGDLFILESIGDDTLDPVWVQGSDLEGEDARVVGGGVDLDGDGRVEFVVGRLLNNRFDLDRTRWLLTIFEHRGGDDEYEVEAEFVVLGGKSQGNGMSMADIDGDGLVELCVALVPDLYVFRAIGPGQYDPVWHTPIRDSHRPLLADLDDDGITEVAYNAVAGVIEIVSLADTRVVELDAPAGLEAVVVGPDRVTVNWESVDGAVDYHLYRGVGADPQELLAAIGETRFVDLMVEEDLTYVYSVAAVQSDQTEGRRSASQSATPASVASLIAVDRLTAHHLELRFGGSMGPSVGEAFRYQVVPGLGSPSSATRDRDGKRVVLAFDFPLPEAGTYELRARDLRTVDGALLASASSSFAFDLEAVTERPRLLHAQLDEPTQLLLRFNTPLRTPLATGGITIDGGRVLVAEATVLSPTQVAVRLDEATPLHPWGRRYEIVISGWRDASGASVSSRTFVQWAPEELDGLAVFPNPFDPSRGTLVFGALPVGSRVSVFSMTGGLLRRLVEREGAGGVEWDGRNQSGELVGSGLYYYQVEHEGTMRTGSLAVIRR